MMHLECENVQLRAAIKKATIQLEMFENSNEIVITPTNMN